MSATKYRAVIQYPNWTRESKPYQQLGNKLDVLEEWCRIRVQKDPDGDPQPDGTEAVIYETIERPVFLVQKSSDAAGGPVLKESEGAAAVAGAMLAKKGT